MGLAMRTAIRGMKLFGLLLVLGWVIFPVYLMVKISLSPPEAVLRPSPEIGLHQITLEHWRRLVSSGGLYPPLGKSLAVAGLTVLLSLLIGVPSAYAISRLPRSWSYRLSLAMFLSRMLPEVVIALPIAVMFIRLNLLDTVIGLVFAHTVKALPVACWLLIGVFRSIPRDLEEQASVDGASTIQILFRIVIPLSLGGIAVAGVFAWLLSWDEFTYAIYLCLAKPTLPLKVYYYVNRGDWFLTSAYAVITTLPVVVLTYILHLFLREDVFAGSLKE